MTSLRNSIAALAVSLPLVAAAQQPAAPEAAPAAPPAAAPAPTAPAPAAAPAPAKPPLAQLYGTLNVNLQYTEASDATAPGANVKPRLAISTDSTNIGVRGGLEFAPGYQAVYQCETSANIDGESVSGICNRNSRIGLSSTLWGTLFYGNWDTPYKSLAYATKADDPFGNTDVFGFQTLFGSPGYGQRTAALNGAATNPAAATPAVQAGFDGRAANSVAYWTPKFSGLSARVQYSVDEFRSAAGKVDPQVLSGAVNFDSGPISIGAAAEYHEDLYGMRTINAANNGTNAAKDLGLKGAAGYELAMPMGALRIMGMIEWLDYKQDDATAGFKEYSRFAWLAGASFRAGNHELRARYGQAMDPDITAARGTTLAPNAEDDLSAQHYAVGYAYHASKSTQLFAFFTQLLNDDRARYTFGVAGAANVVGSNTPVGSDPMAAGLGIRQAF